MRSMTRRIGIASRGCGCELAHYNRSGLCTLCARGTKCGGPEARRAAKRTAKARAAEKAKPAAAPLPPARPPPAPAAGAEEPKPFDTRPMLEALDDEQLEAAAIHALLVLYRRGIKKGLARVEADLLAGVSHDDVARALERRMPWFRRAA